MEFRAGNSPRPTDVFIALIGMTGSGKSSFINHCADGKKPKVGHDLYSCTSEVAVYPCVVTQQTTIYLIDTPGFDDSEKSDTEILLELAAWLVGSYSMDRIKLHGIIYLHDIRSTRMRGSMRSNLSLLQGLVGAGNLSSLILTTTHWDSVVQSRGEAFEKSLIDTPEFWGDMIADGCTTYRHNNTRQAAIDLIQKIASQHQPIVLQIQQQMVDEGLSLDQTVAGRAFVQGETQPHEDKLRSLQAKLTQALEEKDKQRTEALRKLEQRHAQMLEQMQKEHERLRVKYVQLEGRLEDLQRLSQTSPEPTVTPTTSQTQIGAGAGGLGGVAGGAAGAGAGSGAGPGGVGGLGRNDELYPQRQPFPPRPKRQEIPKPEARQDLAPQAPQQPQQSQQPHLPKPPKQPPPDHLATFQQKDNTVLALRPRGPSPVPPAGKGYPTTPNWRRYIRSTPENHLGEDGFWATVSFPSYALIGPKKTISNCPTNLPDGYHVALGISNSWIAYLTSKTDTTIKTSANFDQVYPAVAAKLTPEYKKKHGFLTSVTLGPGQMSYASFQRTGFFTGREHWSWNNVNPDLSKKLKDSSLPPKMVALGPEKSYVVVFKNGNTFSHLPSHLYPQLDRSILNGGVSLKMLTLDPNGSDFFAVTAKKCYMSFSHADGLDFVFQLEEWLTLNADYSFETTTRLAPTGDRIPTWLK